MPANIMIEPPPKGSVSTTQFSLNGSPRARSTRALPSFPRSEILVSSTNRTFAQSAIVNLMWRLAHANLAIQCRWWSTLPLTGRRQDKPAERRRLMTVWALIWRLRLPMIPLEVLAAAVNRARRCDQMTYLSCLLVVTCFLARRCWSATVPVCLNFAHSFWIHERLRLRVWATWKSRR